MVIEKLNYLQDEALRYEKSQYKENDEIDEEIQRICYSSKLILLNYFQSNNFFLALPSQPPPKPYGKEKFLRIQFKLCLSMKA